MSAFYAENSNPSQAVSSYKRTYTYINWCPNLLMVLNIDNCKPLSFVCKPATFDCTYLLGEDTISWTPSYNHLNIHFTTNWSWSTHINIITTNTSRALGHPKHHRKILNFTFENKLRLFTCDLKLNSHKPFVTITSPSISIKLRPSRTALLLSLHHISRVPLWLPS